MGELLVSFFGSSLNWNHALVEMIRALAPLALAQVGVLQGSDCPGFRSCSASGAHSGRLWWSVELGSRPKSDQNWGATSLFLGDNERGLQPTQKRKEWHLDGTGEPLSFKGFVAEVRTFSPHDVPNLWS
jgi:hypothetical protein